MEIALINDVHFGARSDHEAIAEHQKKFFSQIFFPHIDASGIKTIFVLGDLFERRKYINFKTLNNSYDMFFKPALARGIDVHILTGNHDVYHKNTNALNSCDLIAKQFGNVEVYSSTPEVVDFDGCPVGVVPWITDTNRQECSEFLARCASRVIFGHFDVVGFEMMPGVVCELGEDPKIFDRFDKVYTGHYHAKSTKGNITHLGTQYDMDWGDLGIEKQFHVFDTETLGITPIANPNRIFSKIMYSSNMSFDPNDFHQKFLKVTVIRDESFDAYDFDQFMNRVNACSPISVQIIMPEITATTVDTDTNDVDIKSTLSILNTALENVDGVDSKTLNSASKIINDLYAEASAG